MVATLAVAGRSAVAAMMWGFGLRTAIKKSWCAMMHRQFHVVQSSNKQKQNEYVWCKKCKRSTVRTIREEAP